MKDQYFGDVNDYRKYGLLRVLLSETGLTHTLCWMLTPSDGRSDGKFVDYLASPKRWQHLDPPLFEFLARATESLFSLLGQIVQYCVMFVNICYN